MRIQHRYLTFEKNVQLTKLLDTLAVRYKEQEKSYGEGVQSYFLEFFLYEDNPRFAELKKAVQAFYIKPQVGTLYDKADEAQAKWFIASTGEYQYPQPEDSYMEATFDLSQYCSSCGIGKVQNAPYRLKSEPKQQNRQFWGLHWEYEPVFVRTDAKNILEREKIQGVKFSQPVLHRNDIPIQDFYQLHIDTTLNPGFNPYNTNRITCKINNEENCNLNSDINCCGRIKFHHPRRGGYLFEPTTFHANHDIAMSHEYFGSGASANRLVIVSKRLKEIIDKHRLKGLGFVPIVHSKLEQA